MMLVFFQTSALTEDLNAFQDFDFLFLPVVIKDDRLLIVLQLDVLFRGQMKNKNTLT